jgi:hypothetical protein
MINTKDINDFTEVSARYGVKYCGYNEDPDEDLA